MPCSSITTGSGFLAGTLAHIDCQAKSIGSLGFGALADPGSVSSLALAGLLTVFVALFGLRLLLGFRVDGRDLILDVLKVAIVLTLATSWPAWRTLGYDLVIDGPSHIAQAIGLASQLPGSGGDFAERLQLLDAGVAALNIWGSGRLGVAQGDWFQLGLARVVWLIGTLGPLALVRISAGILLALAPLMAGLLLFRPTRALFEGWLRALAMTFLASVFLALILCAEMALLEPWLADALQRRAGDMQTLDAPVEFLVIAMSFALFAYGAIAFAARIAFHPSTTVTVSGDTHARATVSAYGTVHQAAPLQVEATRPRAHEIAGSVSEGLRREERQLGDRRTAPAQLMAQHAGGGLSGATDNATSRDALGTRHRRKAPRISGAQVRRDNRS